MDNLKQYEVWFVTGSQHLYGDETLKQVADHARAIARGLDDNSVVPVSVVYKPVLTTSDAIHKLCLEASRDENCIGLITWMHTFSPARMWINGLGDLTKPFVHFHTQFNRDIPWDEIDMDYMNLNQSAHGGREFGFIGTRMRKDRKVVVGHWQDPEVLTELATWLRAAAAWHNGKQMRIARFGDNMRNVAVTEGDKVAAQIQLGYEVNGYGVGDLVTYVNSVTEAQIDELLDEYEDKYLLAEEVRKGGSKRQSLRDAARIELGMLSFLQEGNFQGFTTTFEDLHGLKQLPGLAVQRLMAAGYGFGAEGDWKTAALLRTMKVMSAGLPQGTSFMEDYVYHLDPAGNRVLGAHMLEVCESIAASKPRLEVQPLGIGGKEDPARLIFDTTTGPAINASLIDLGNRFRLIVNKVEAVEAKPLPKLPVARVLWDPKPNLRVAAASWILAGGAHHTVFSQALTEQHLADYAEMAGVEYVLIDEETRVPDLKKELKWNDLYYHLAKGI